jgi:UDP-N-acetyl-2-amino-2-deoxyglucuronate dehydrogenase
MADQKRFRFGIIGAGVIGDFHAKAIQHIPNAELAYIYGRNIDKTARMAEKYECKACEDYTQMLDDDSVDIVTIATPSGLHYRPVLDAAQAGKHVICEKPLEITLKRIDEMIAAHEKAGTYLGCIFQNRFTEAMAPLKKAVREGRFGTITFAGVFVPWWRKEHYYENSWHGTWELDGGGALMNQSIHMVDMLCDLLGPVESVQAYCDMLGHCDMETEDTAVASLRFQNKALGLIYGSTASYPGQFKRFEITGTKGTVIYLEDSIALWQFSEEEPEDRFILEKYSHRQSDRGGVADPSDISFKHHQANIKAFIDAIASSQQFELDGKKGRKAVELVLAIYESANTNNKLESQLKGGL